ncbi:MAG: beta-ketoacyl-ACP synthase [Burkholderiaceae bacterium]
MPLSTPVSVTAYTATSALGSGMMAHASAVKAHKSGLQNLMAHAMASSRPTIGVTEKLETWVGQVAGLDAALPGHWSHWDCRNNRLAWMGLQADGFAAAVRDAARRHGTHRVAVILGSSTASIGATEAAYRQLASEGVFPPQPNGSHHLHTLHSLAMFVQEALGLTGPCTTVSTACSSSAKTFASGARLLALDLADAVVVGGVDTLCGSVIFGFNALQLVSPEPCRPFDRQRRGINLGEAAGFALLERGRNGLRLLGTGESSDAYHLSAPQPSGHGALTALDQALRNAGVDAAQIDFLHAHGTATPKNDAIEAQVIARRFPARTRVSSTKGFTGHALGAAGALGAAFCLHALETGVMPGTVGTQSAETGIDLQLLLEPTEQAVRTAACHAFGFGGSNCVLVFGQAEGNP